MTGSAGTAVDVLVTCESKWKGRRFGGGGLKNGVPPPGRGLLSVVQFGFFLIFFPEMSLKHTACHTFRASEGSRKVS